jgi:hypothetical protein
MSTIKEDIKSYVHKNDHVTFAELSNRINNFSGGGISICMNQNDNFVVWVDMTKDAADAINELIRENQIHITAAGFITYLTDGRTLNLPLAQGNYQYKTPHWVPVLLRPGANPKLTRKHRTKNK